MERTLSFSFLFLFLSRWRLSNYPTQITSQYSIKALSSFGEREGTIINNKKGHFNQVAFEDEFVCRHALCRPDFTTPVCSAFSRQTTSTPTPETHAPFPAKTARNASQMN